MTVPRIYPQTKLGTWVNNDIIILLSCRLFMGVSCEYCTKEHMENVCASFLTFFLLQFLLLIILILSISFY